MKPRTITPQELRSVDRDLLVAMRSGDAFDISDLTASLGVTATAVRQRIERLLDRGLLHREKVVAGRGRPTYKYVMTPEGHRCAGANPADLADAMWRTIVGIEDEDLRAGLLAAIASKLGQRFAKALETDQDQSLQQRLDHLSKMMTSNQISASVSSDGNLPVLDIESCPYPSLTDASSDRAMCKLEEKMLTEALGHPVHLSSCRLDGDQCCQFSPAPVETAVEQMVVATAQGIPSPTSTV